MKIVQIEEIFHPLAGYQPNLLSKYFSRLGHDVTIVTCEADKITQKFTSFFDCDDIEKADFAYSQKYGVKIIRKPVYGHFNRKNFLKFGITRYIKTLKKIKKIKPDILFIHGNEQVISMLAFLMYRYMKMPYITDSHMVAMAMEGKPRRIFYSLYRKMITPILIKNNITNIRTQDEDFVEKYLGIPLSQCPWISVGSDIMLFYPDMQARRKFREEHKITDTDFVVIYAGKLDQEKDGLLLAKSFKRVFNSKKITLVVVGNTNDDEYGKVVEATFRSSENRVLRFPTQNYETLAVFYQAADLAVFPRQCSLSFFDVQACGIPIVSENNNINVDRLQFGNGLCFRSGDIKDFREKVTKISNLSSDEYKKMSDNAYNFVVQNYNYENIAKQYVDEMLRSIERYHCLRNQIRGFHR